MDTAVWRVSEKQNLDPKYLERWANAYTHTLSMPDDGRLDLESWGRPESCGTVACIAGHCGLHPWFRRRGLVFNPYKGLGGVKILSTSSGWIGTDVSNFFGVWFYQTPLSHQYLGYANLGGKPSVKEAAQSLRDYMVLHWGEAATEKAISQATAVYAHVDVNWEEATGE